MRYLPYLMADLAFDLLARLLAPVLPLFATMRLGPVDNNNGAYRVEPRLPRWLAWFMTPDNSLLGDTGWRTIHCVKHWQSYRGMVLWLWRNSATGFARSVLAQTVKLADVKTEGDITIIVDSPARYGKFYATDGKTFQWKVVFPLFNKSIGLNVGWLMDTMIRDQTPEARCPFKFAPKIKDK